MSRREQPAAVHEPRRSAREPVGRRSPAPPQIGRCFGAAAQLAAVHSTLRHGAALQLRAGGGGGGPGAAPRAAPANRTGLPDRLKAGVEALSGVSLDGVKVHYNSSKPAQLNALAYAQGSDIHLAPGQERHLPHETWHIVQQAQGRVRPTLQMKDGVPVNDDAGLEREADRMGVRAFGLAATDGSRTRPPVRPAGTGGACQLLAKGGLEYTETSTLRRRNSLVNLTNGTHDTVPTQMSVLGAAFVVYHVSNADLAHLGPVMAQDADVWQHGRIRLTNDTTSPEWIIEGHAAGTSKDGLLYDIGTMFAMRRALQAGLNGYAGLHPGEHIVFTPAANVGPPHLVDRSLVFEYLMQAQSDGAAQITLKYKNVNTMQRIAEVNLSRYLKGGAIANDVEYLRTTSDAGWLMSKLASDSAPVAQELRGTLAGQSQAITNGLVTHLTAADVGIIKMMILSDAMAVVVRRYTAGFGQSDDKNMQRFFPKARRQHYVHALAQLELPNAALATLRNDLTASAAAMIAAFMAQLELKSVPLTHLAQGNMAIVTRGAHVHSDTATLAERQTLQDDIFGVHGARLTAAVGEAVNAYTEMAATVVAAAEERHVLPGGAQPRGAVVSSMAYANPLNPNGSYDPGATFELRNNEVPMGETNLDPITAALDTLFAVA